MSFTEHAIAADADGVRWVHIVDLDQDYDLDILAALSVSDSVVWFARRRPRRLVRGVWPRRARARRYENLCEGQVYARDQTFMPYVNNIQG